MNINLGFSRIEIISTETIKKAPKLLKFLELFIVTFIKICLMI